MDAAAGISERPVVRRDGRQIALAGCGLAGLAAVAVAATVAGSGAAEQPALVALARALMVGAPIGVGLYAWRHGPDERFGLLLIAAGAGWFVTTLAESGDELLYTLGRTAGWLVEVLLVYLILSFPTGKLRERTDRLLVGAMATVVAAFFLPQLVLAESFEVPSPFTSCTHDCPANGVFALGSEPAFVDAILRPVGVVLVFAVMGAVVLRLWQRIRGATPLTRRMLTPVLAIAMVRAGALAVAIVGRDVDPTAWPVEVAAWLLALALPAIALAFLAGLLRWRLFTERALRRLAEWVRGLPDAVTLRRAFAEAFDDPTVEIVFPASSPDARWMDCWGHPAGLPGPGTGRSVSEVRNRGSVVAAIVHDEGLGARPELVQAGVSMAGVVLDNQRLAAEAQASLLELERSRARIAAGAAQERRRIERDLHDGAQQRLVALRIELELAEDLVRSDPTRGVARLRELEHGLDEALEELRALAHGVYPPLLADRGLVEALRAAAARSTIPVELAAHGVGRFGPEVESAVYFCILEALQNALKHASGARRVVVRIDGGPRDELRFSVRDDGAGTPNLRAGAGITNMRDRLAAVGGDVEVASTPRVGTVVRGRVPTLGQAA
jgi:signal transduction histidine kinase